MEELEREIIQKLAEQAEELKGIKRSVEKTRRYLFWTFVISVLFIVLPLIGLILIIPQFLASYSGIMELNNL